MFSLPLFLPDLSPHPYSLKFIFFSFPTKIKNQNKQNINVIKHTRRE